MGEICAGCQKRDKQEEIPKCAGCLKIFEAANLRFAELMHCAAVDTAEDNSLIFAVCNRYLKWVKENRKDRTYQRAEFFLTKFSEEIGHLKVKDLKPFHVEDWLAKMASQRTVDTEKGPQRRGWGKSSRRMALDVVLACLNYAVKKGFITKNPLSGKVDRPGAVSRSKDALISPNVFQTMLIEQEKKYQPRYYPSHGGYFVLFKNKPILLVKGPEGDESTLAAAHARLAELVQRTRHLRRVRPAASAVSPHGRTARRNLQRQAPTTGTRNCRLSSTFSARRTGEGSRLHAQERQEEERTGRVRVRPRTSRNHQYAVSEIPGRADPSGHHGPALDG